MKKRKEQALIALGLIFISFVVYVIHYAVFKDLHHLLVFLVEDIAFIPIEVLIVSLILEKILEKRELNHKMEKMNMIIGVFFSEIGNEILRLIAESDGNTDQIKDQYMASENWYAGGQKVQIASTYAYAHNIDMQKLDLQRLKNILSGKNDFLITLMENPVLMEHDNFTDMIMGLFHIKEEFSYRKEIAEMNEKDIKHLKGDVERVYKPIVIEWIRYMNHMKEEYPYLFMTAMKHNPYDGRGEEEIEKVLVDAFNKMKR